MSIPGYDAWKLASPDDVYIPDNEREEDCECRHYVGDNEWCPVHGRDPDRELDERRENPIDRWASYD